MIGRALDLAFRTEQFSALDLVVKDLDASTDPNTLKVCYPQLSAISFVPESCRILRKQSEL